MSLKTEEQLREEIIEDFGWNEEDNKEQIDKVLKLKKDRYSATQSKQKYKDELSDMKKGKEHYKTQAKKVTKAKEAKEEAKEDAKISADDKSYLFAKGMSRTEVRHLEKVMGQTKKSWEKALSDNLYTTFKKENDAVIKRRGSTLGASHGGSEAAKGTIQAEVVEEFSKDLPAGLAGQKKD